MREAPVRHVPYGGFEASAVIRVCYEAVVSAGRIHSRCPIAAAC